MYRVTILITLGILFFVHYCYAWRVVPAQKASYALRAKDEGVDALDYDYEQSLPRNTLHTIYKFGWCKPDTVEPTNRAKSANYTIQNLLDADTQWIYVLDAENIRKFNLQCTVVKVYVNIKNAFLRTRIPFHYCQGSVIYLMLSSVGKMMIHEFYFMTAFSMPATFVFEYYHPMYV